MHVLANHRCGMYPVIPLDRITNVPINTDVAAINDFLKTIEPTTSLAPTSTRLRSDSKRAMMEYEKN